MTCREFDTFLCDYCSARLTVSERAQFERHLVGCPNCAAYLKSYQHTVALGKAAFLQLDDPVPNDVPEELIRAILAVTAT